MRFVVRLGLAGAMGLALFAGTPATFASAAPVQHAQAPHLAVANGHLAVAIPLTPGRHVVSGAMTLSAAAHPVKAAASSSPTIHVRVGPNNCAGYNGEIFWVYFPTITAWVIDTYGVLWDNCYSHYSRPSTVYVYVSYNELDEPRQNFQAFSLHDAGPGGVSQGVDSGDVPTMDIFGPSDIVITACIQSINGWQCGAGQKV